MLFRSKKKKTEQKNANAGPKHTRGGLCVFTADAQCTDGLFNVFGHYYKKDKLAIFFYKSCESVSLSSLYMDSWDCWYLRVIILN